MEARRYVVLTDGPVPDIAFGLVVLLGKNESGTGIGQFDSLEEAKVFAGTFRSNDIQRGWNAGRLRIFDQGTKTVVFEIKA
jgi:hypothetical protein